MEKHRQSGKLDLREVKDYFIAKDYEPVRTEQAWRHVTGILRKEKLIKNGGWAEEIPRDITDLMKFIKERFDYWQLAPSHGDFVPWHFVRDDKAGFLLVDGEHAHILGPKFYDVAYFYHRVFTKLKRPDIADNFLKEFADLYEFSEGEKELFMLVLAERLIGGYFDAEKDGITSVNLQDQLRTKLLQRKLFPPED